MSEITVVIATIPPRKEMLARALNSVGYQTRSADLIVIEPDPNHTGAAATKNRGIAKVTSEFVAMLDDDDEFWPEHLEKLLAAQQEHQADVVYSMPFIPGRPGGMDPCGRFGQPFDADELRKRSYIQTTSLIRTELLKAAGGFQIPEGRGVPYDDWGAFLALLDLGAKFFHVAEQTFTWHHHGYGRPGVPGNTSGDPSRW
jgi:glycosyltransferase involved in cell wall biosynthesis